MQLKSESLGVCPSPHARFVILRYKMRSDQDLYDRAYAYIVQYY